MTGADTVIWGGLLPGAEYTVSEVPETGYTSGALTCDGVDDTDGDDSDASVTFIAPLGNGDPATVEIGCSITNELDLYDLVISKDVTGPAAEYHLDSEFTISVDCSLGGVPVPLDPSTFVIGDGVDATVPGLPLGTSCTIVETETQDAYTTVVDGVTGVEATVTIGELNMVVVQNLFEVGSISVTKTVGGAAGAYYSDVEFEFSVACTYRGVELDGLGSFSLTDGGEYVIDDLPLGASCTITETSTGDAEVTTVNGATGTSVDLVVGSIDGSSLDPDVVATAEFVNTFEGVALTVTKALTGTGASTNATKTFSFEVSCVLDSVSIDSDLEGTAFKLGANGQSTIDGLPVGADCTVTETDSQGAKTVTMNNIDGASITVTMSYDQTVDVVNEFVAPTTTTTSKSSYLPAAGASSMQPLMIAVALTLAGLVLLVGATRRRRRTAT